MNLRKLKQHAMMEEAIASAELAEEETPTPKTVEEVVAEFEEEISHWVDGYYHEQADADKLVETYRQTLLAQNQAARTAGYQAAVADLSGKPLSAIELMYDEAYARGYKEAEERLREVAALLKECEPFLSDHSGVEVTTLAYIPPAEAMRRAAKRMEYEAQLKERVKASIAKHGITNL